MKPAFILFGRSGDGEFRFGVVVANLVCAYSGTDVGFEFQGSDEGMEILGDGWLELDETGSIFGEFDFLNGDSSTFKARRW